MMLEALNHSCGSMLCGETANFRFNSQSGAAFAKIRINSFFAQRRPAKIRIISEGRQLVGVFDPAFGDFWELLKLLGFTCSPEQ